MMRDFKIVQGVEPFSLLGVCRQRHGKTSISSPTHRKPAAHPVAVKPKGTPQVHGVTQLRGLEQLGV